MGRPTVAAVFQRSSERELLRSSVSGFRGINVVSISGYGDSLRDGSVIADVVVLDLFAPDAEATYLTLKATSPETKVFFVTAGTAVSAGSSVPPNLLFTHGEDETMEDVVLRFLASGSSGQDSAARPPATRPPATESAAPQSLRTHDHNQKARAAGRPAMTKPGGGRAPILRPVAAQSDATKSAATRPALVERRVPRPRTPKPDAVGRPAKATASLPTSPTTPTTPTRPGAPSKRTCVLIGASTGGPEAVKKVLAGLPASFPIPILVVQHMPATFTTEFARSLDGSVGLDVREAFDGAQPKRGEVWIAPGGYHMVIADVTGRIGLTKAPKVLGCRPSVDVLFESAVRAFGQQVVGVVLTGMGQDGTDGSKRIAAAGGYIIAQDQATSRIWGMPGSVVQQGVANQVVPLNQVARAISGQTSIAQGTTLLAAGGNQ